MRRHRSDGNKTACHRMIITESLLDHTEAQLTWRLGVDLDGPMSPAHKRHSFECKVRKDRRNSQMYESSAPDSVD